MKQPERSEALLKPDLPGVAAAPTGIVSAKGHKPPAWLCPDGQRMWCEKLDRYMNGGYKFEADAEQLGQLCEAEVNLNIKRGIIRAEELRDKLAGIDTNLRKRASPATIDARYWFNQHRVMLKACKFLRSREYEIKEPEPENPFIKLLAKDDSLIHEYGFVSPHVTAAHQYAYDVTEGVIPACRDTILACQRHLDNMDDLDFGYVFSPYLAHRVCEFISNLPHVKGKWAMKRELLVLSPWECFIVSSLFGWIDPHNGMRRFNEAYLEICRKNGKSILAAAIGLFMMVADGEHGAEVYSGATTEKQAWEVFRPARLMLMGTPLLCAAAGVSVKAKHLIRPVDGSRFEPLIGKPGDGASPSCAIVDEFHEHDTPDFVDTMQTGMLAREQPLLLKITTAGYNLAGPCYEHRFKALQVLNGSLENERLFCLIYGIDQSNEKIGLPGDDWADPASLRKANPNLGVSVDEESLIAFQRSAVMNVSEQVKFKTKHLNIWCSARTTWISLQQWQAAADPALVMDELKGETCWFMFDLASKLDIAAYMVVFRKYVNDMAHYYVFGRYYLPEEQITAPGKNQAVYQKWHRKGILTVTEGATTDFERIRDDMVADASKFKPNEVVYDPFNATHMSQLLMDDGLSLVEFIQKPQNFAVPMDEVQAALKDGRFHHDGNEMLTWMMSNVTVRPAKKGLFWPTKEAIDQKIDGPVAMIMGIGRALADESDRPLGNPFADAITA